MEVVVSYKFKISVLIKALLLCAFLSGCVRNGPLVIDPNKDMSKAFPRTKKIPAKVGIYIGEDLNKYVYNQQKIGLTFQMNVGEYLPPIALQMASSMFEEVTPVNSLPPYNKGYKPDVEAVVVPEILYCYGNAVGTLSGYIEGKALIRITAYDLSGRVLWQDKAMGESRSSEMSFAGVYTGGMEEVGKIGYQAAFAAAVKIINDFNARHPNELYSLLEMENVATLKNRQNISNFEIFKNYYKKAQLQYEKKNYYQALYSFEKADKLNSDDLSTLFYIGACYNYTASKAKALEKFRRVVDLGPKSQEANDARKWIVLLSEPLKIAIVTSSATSDRGLNDNAIRDALQDSRMYELVDVSELKPPRETNPQKKWSHFLDRCFKKSIKIVIFTDIDSLAKKIKVDQQPSGDVATEHEVKVLLKAYSAKKKEVKADIKVIERKSTISQESKEKDGVIKQQLLKRGAEKVVLRLLENDIY
jgi:tetratricopeptide (TPR) repeat protein